MSLLRLRPLTRAIRPSNLTATPFRPSPRIQTRNATQDYGSGDGNPAAENPQAQGERGREDLEHPGPEAPDVGKKSGSGKGEGGKGGKGGPQPKILDENVLKEGKGESEDVKRHNREMEGRADRANEGFGN